MNNVVWIVLDSCRFDSFIAAKTPNISKIGEVEKRYSYASWTVPSHTVYLMGVAPHQNPKGVFASEVYKKEFARWSDRLGIKDISFKSFVPKLSLPAYLKNQGYRTHALVSMPVLNQATVLNQHFDRYQLMSAHNDFSAMIDLMLFESDRPSYYLLNVGETHYPYTLPGESADHLPRIHGVHGVFKHMDDTLKNGISDEGRFFNLEEMQAMHQKQISNIEYLDRLFEKLYQKLPKNTYLIVTADHGELFGEDNFFGHGPVVHEKVLEVFWVEGLVK